MAPLTIAILAMAILSLPTLPPRGYTYYMVILTTAILTMQPTLEAIFLDICGAAAERSAPSSGGGGGGSGDDGGGGGGGGGSPRTRVAPAISPPMATAEAVARSAAHSGVPLAKLATPVEFDGGGLQSC